MNTIPSPQTDGKIARGKSKSPNCGGATVVFKRSFNLNTLSEHERLATRALLERLTSSPPARPQP